MSTSKRYVILAIALVLIGGTILYLENKKVHPGSFGGPVATVGTSTVHTADYATRVLEYPQAPELVSPDGYINTNGMPITLSSLIGKKVILLDFWTYSCINCQRTIPYLNSWYDKYKDQGLEIIGVHTPEFDFEKQQSNVQAAVEKFGITYPVIMDSNYGTWNAYNNQYWPEEYLIDINGLVVDRKIGEGNYADTEKKIQQLLNERMQALGQSGTINSAITDIDQTIDAQSPETYFGSARNLYLANGTPQKAGTQTLTLPPKIDANALYLSGTWNFQDQFAENTTAGAKIEYSYNAKNVYFVASSEKGVTITILRDGKPVQTEKGADIDASGNATIKESRLYHLIDESTPGTHTLEIIVNGAGLDAYTFTFG